jgi:hypothetical protein
VSSRVRNSVILKGDEPVKHWKRARGTRRQGKRVQGPACQESRTRKRRRKWACKNCGELGHFANSTLKRKLARGLPRSGLELDVMVHEQFSRRMIERG